MKKTKNKIAAAFLIVTSTVFAQQSSTPLTPSQRQQQLNQQAAQDVAVQKATVQGTVFKIGAGQPLKRARVTLRRTDLMGAQTGTLPSGQAQPAQARNSVIQTTTDDNGQYVLSVDAGSYRVAVDHDGYIHLEYGQKTPSGSGTILTIAAAQKLTGLDFQMSPAGVITGKVTDEDGEPLVRADVTAYSYVYNQGKRTLQQTANAQTDDLGQYRLFYLNPGDYYVSANARLNGPGLGGRNGGPGGPGGRGSAPAPAAGVAPQQELSYVATFFPGTTIPETASVVSLGAAGEVRGIDINLRPIPTVHVRGRAITPMAFDASAQTASSNLGTGRGAGPRGGLQARRGPQINITLSRSGFNGRNFGFGGGPGRANVADDGSFEIAGVIPGTYTMVAVSRQGTMQYTARQKIEVGDSDVNNVGLSLRPSINVTGRVTIDGQPQASFQITSMHISLVATDDSQQLGGGGGANTQVAADGTFTLSNVAPLEYRLRVNGLPTGSYVGLGRIGPYDALNAPFVVSNDQDLALQLQVSFEVGKVQGTVVDNKGDPYLGAVAALVPDDPARQRTELYFSSATDQYGHFTFNNVPKGGYKMFAWEEIPAGAYQDPDFIRQYEDQGKAIKVEAASTVMEQIKVIPANP